MGLNILSAQIFTRADNVVLDTFFVTDAQTGSLATREQRDKFEKLLTSALTNADVDFSKLIARRPPLPPLYQSPAGEQIVTTISFDNEISDERTAIEIETEDRVGLLYAISQTLSKLHVDIASAKISTEKGAAIDTFYVSEHAGGKLHEPTRQRAIEKALRTAISALDGR
jgi:[protein-PII] uridylyltransferase